jgi:nicotinamide mononucleotide transporter
MDPLELVASALGLLAVWYNVKEDVKGWPVGAAMVALYFLIFARVKLYADAGLQVFFFIMQFYGWYEWLRGGENHGRLEVSRTPRLVVLVCVLGGGVGTFLLGTLLGRYTDQALPFWDSSIAAFSLVAQWMLARKYLENWILWMLIDVVAIGVYWAKGLMPTTLLYAIFFLLCVRGYLLWRRTLLVGQATAV